MQVGAYRRNAVSALSRTSDDTRMRVTVVVRACRVKGRDPPAHLAGSGVARQQGGCYRRRVRARIAVGLLVTALVASWAASTLAESRVFSLDVKNGALAAGQREIKVQQGDEVTLRWTTDAPLTVHLHGYDLERAIAPGAPVEMRFTARATGRFPIERHGTKGGRDSTLTYVEVYPR